MWWSRANRAARRSASNCAEMLLNQTMSIGTEALLMFRSARLEHVEQVIKPALHAGKWVISDRFRRCQFAYQGGGRGLALG